MLPTVLAKARCFPVGLADGQIDVPGTGTGRSLFEPPVCTLSLDVLIARAFGSGTGMVDTEESACHVPVEA